jgi:hypothetical protein
MRRLAYYKVLGRKIDQRRKARGGNMKKELFRGLTMLTVIVALALASAVASAKPQSVDKVVADIPFEFSVGYKTMPAGEYSVKSITNSGNGLLIQSADGTISALRLSNETSRDKNKSHARLVFHRYGDRYFLAEVWTGIDNTGRQLVKSQEERAIERELASTSTKDQPAPATYETVEVLAMLR